MTSILSDIAGFGRSGGLFERAVTRERMPVLAASFDASAALARGSALLIGGLDGTLGQTIRALSLTTPHLTLGSPLRFGSFQTGSLSRGLWSGGMPMFPISGGMWPGMMGAGGMFGAPAGTYAGGHAGGSPGYTTPRRLMAQDRGAASEAAATDTAKSSATPAAAKSGTTAATAATPAGAGKTAPAGKTGPTLAEKKEQQWKKAAERVVTAVQKNKGLKDTISVTVNVVGRTLTVTPKPGAKPSETQLTAFVKAITKLVNGKGPLGGSTLVIGGKKYDGKIAMTELVKTLMPAAVDSKVVAQEFETELTGMLRPDDHDGGDLNFITVSVDAATQTVKITTIGFPSDADCADEGELTKLLKAVFVKQNADVPLKGVKLVLGGKAYSMFREDEIKDMVAKFVSTPPN